MDGFVMLWNITLTLILNGLVGGTLVLALIQLGRRCLHRISRRAAVWLWIPLLLVVLSPLLPGIAIRLPDISQTLPTETVLTDIPVNAAPDVIDTALHPEDVTVQITQTDPVISIERSLSWQGIAGLVWLCGALAVLGYQTVRHARVRQLCRTAQVTECRGRIRICTLADIRTPFVCGLFRPHIFLPKTPTVGAQEREMILRHEMMHLRRLDVLWRLLWEAALCVYWFQPLFWIAEDAFIADTEGACDEAVLLSLGADKTCRADYAETLLLYAGPKKRGYPTAFGMTEMQRRVHMILYPAETHAAAMVGLVVVILLAVAAALLTFPSEDRGAGVGDAALSETGENGHTVTVFVDATSEIFGFVDGYVENHPEIWGPTEVRFTLPIGWNVHFDGDGALTGQIYDDAGTPRGSCFVQAFSPIDAPDIPPENIPPDDRKWQAIYADLRLSMMQNVADDDYHPIVTGDRFENAVAVMDQAIYEEGVPAATWEHQRVPLVLAYDQDCSMYLQLTFDASMEHEIMEMIAASVAFEKVP